MRQDADVLVAVQSCDRPWMLRWCLEHLARQKLGNASMGVEVYDDGSSREFEWAIRQLWNDDVIRGLEWGMSGESPKARATTKAEADARCGAQRQRIVEHFLEFGRWPYLLLLDDDIALGPYVVRTLLDDFRMIRSSGIPVGAMAVHGGHTVHSEVVYGRTLFGHLNLTGEAAVLLSRECLGAVGNHFGPHKCGYADTQWEAMRQKHWTYLTRVNPPHDAQHMGLGDGSVIQHGRADLFWLRDAWRANIPGKPYLAVPSFDVEEYVREVKAKGCRATMEAMVAALDNQITKERVGT